MPRTRPTAKELVVDAPLEWVEERSGFVGLVEAFLFRKVPGDTSWLQTLGSSLLTVFLLQATTGVILAMSYHPDPASAYEPEFMDRIATGQVVHAGTLNGNPISLAAAKAGIEELARDHGAAYQRIWSLGEQLRTGIEDVLRSAGHTIVTAGAGPVFHVSFMDRPARTYRETLLANNALYSDFALALLDEAVLVLPDGRWYVSAAHTQSDIRETLEAVRRAL